MPIPVSRSPSYRKPVPEYVPSPPPSPVAVPLPAVPLYNLSKEVPPLPDNWRQILAGVSSDDLVKRNKSSTNVKGPRPRLDSRQDGNLKSAEHPGSMNVHKQNASVSTLTGSQYTNDTHRHRRGLPKYYRPPTPPLLSGSRSHSVLPPSSRATVTKSPVHRSELNLSNPVYPSGYQAANYLGIYAQSRAGVSYTTFQTETLTPSLHPSLGWARRLDPHKTLDDDLTIPDRASSMVPRKCWKFSFRSWLRRLRTSRLS